VWIEFADAEANPEDIDLGEDEAMEEEDVQAVQEKAVPVRNGPHSHIAPEEFTPLGFLHVHLQMSDFMPAWVCCCHCCVSEQRLDHLCEQLQMSSIKWFVGVVVLSSASMLCAMQDAVFQAAGAGQEELGALDRFAKKRKLGS
jgi:hypothetical protein